MASSDSMYIFDLCIKELTSFTACKKFVIRSQFADLFSCILNDPNEKKATLLQKKGKQRVYMRYGKSNIVEKFPKDHIGQSILLASNMDNLISNMKSYPMEISLWSKMNLTRLGSTHILWPSIFFNYLKNLHKKQPPAVVEGNYFIFDEVTSRRMATIKLYARLTHVGNKITAPILTSITETEYHLNADQNLNTDKSKLDVSQDTGIIKTIYGGGTRKFKLKSNKKKNVKKLVEVSDEKIKEEFAVKTETNKKLNNLEQNNKINKSIASLVRSNADINSNKQITLRKSRSNSSIELKQRFDTLNYIFGDPKGSFGNKVYCVGYVTVEKELAKSPGSSSHVSIKTRSDKGSPVSLKLSESPIKTLYKVRTCGSECLVQRDVGEDCLKNICTQELPDEAAHIVNIRKCTKLIECDNLNRERPKPSNDHIYLDLTNLSKVCCQVDKLEEVIGGVKGKIKVGKDPCYCSCDCTFGFTKKTTYCAICGGYEVAGDEIGKSVNQPIPCPIYHNTVEKNKMKSAIEQKPGKGRKHAGLDKTSVENIESEKEGKKGKKKKKDDRFKFNYGYQGIPPHIGHSQCAMPCTGTLGQVPKHMGWLWTADNVPGMKFRPNWKPGAANKHVVRLLKIAKNPEQVLAKRRRRDAGKKKKSLKRPLLIVHKKDGEFTVTMETMRMFSKQRAVNQQPYEDKPVLTYTIGRTEEENRERQRRKERAQRRLEREQRSFIQSAFKDMCKEICLKTYQQAMEILPGAEDPDCTCYPAEPGPDQTDLEHSCSCSDQSKSSIVSDTDDDEWIVEFTPPNAYFDPTFKGKKQLKVENSSQYTYLDYKVKLLDRYGNPVPRFFKGPDGKQQCSDLGGFWSPEKKWLDINFDGYIAPDGRWAPNIFIGPGDEHVDAETGKFQLANGQWLVVGVDGYVDSQNKWRYYPKPKDTSVKKRIYKQSSMEPAGGDKANAKEVKQSEATWSCFGDASPRQLSHMGIVGHGHDRKLLLATLEKMIEQGKDIKMPQQSTVPHLPKSKRGRKYRVGPDGYDMRSYYTNRLHCRHPKPSVKGIVMDTSGHKTYFRLTDHKNKRPRERLGALGDQGISLSSFHVPCFTSFINSEVMKQQQYDRAMRYAAKKDVTSQIAV